MAPDMKDLAYYKKKNPLPVTMLIGRRSSAHVSAKALLNVLYVSVPRSFLDALASLRVVCLDVTGASIFRVLWTDFKWFLMADVDPCLYERKVLGHSLHFVLVPSCTFSKWSQTELNLDFSADILAQDGVSRHKQPPRDSSGSNLSQFFDPLSSCPGNYFLGQVRNEKVRDFLFSFSLDLSASIAAQAYISRCDTDW